MNEKEILIVSQKIEIDPTYKQKEVFENYFNYSRFIYNKALTHWKEMYELFKKDPEHNEEPCQYNILKWIRSNREDWEKSELEKKDYEKSNSMILETTLKNLGCAFRNFKSKSYKQKYNFPKFKSKKSCRKTFWYFKKKPDLGHVFRIEGDKQNKLYLVTFSKKYGLIKMKEPLRFEEYDIREVHITRKADKYFASFVLYIYKDCYKKPRLKENFIGVDLGIRKLATCYDSNGKILKFKGIFSKIKRLKKKSDKLASVASKKRSIAKKENRDIHDSKKYSHVITKRGRTFLKISNVSHDYIHKLTNYLCMNYRYICIEDLKVKRMFSKIRSLFKFYEQTLFYEFRRQLEYKSDLYGNTIIVIPRDFPSTQTCSNCGHVFKGKEKIKREKTYKCPNCGLYLNRDVNAAKNLMEFGRNYIRSENKKL